MLAPPITLPFALDAAFAAASLPAISFFLHHLIPSSTLLSCLRVKAFAAPTCLAAAVLSSMAFFLRADSFLERESTPLERVFLAAL